MKKLKSQHVICINAFFALFWGCQQADAETEKAQTKDTNAVRTIPLETATLVSRLAYSGDVEGEAEIRVYSPIPDRIVSIKVREGDRVKAGHILAIIRSTALTQGVLQAAGGLEAASVRRSALEDQLSRMRALNGSGAVSSSQLQTMESELAASKAQVRQFEATVGQAKERKGDSIIRAPISGVIGQTFLKAGDLAAPGVPICTVVDMDRVKIKARVPERDLAQLRPGQPVRYRLASGNEEFRYGNVSRVSPVLDRLSRTATLEVDVDNADHGLKPGMLARIEVEVDRREDVLWVPKDAITVTTKTQGDKTIFRAVVVDGGKADVRDVVIGLEDDLRVEVLRGLKAGEAVVVAGQHLLSTGDPVRIVDQEGTGAAKTSTEPKPKAEDGIGDKPDTERNPS